MRIPTWTTVAIVGLGLALCGAVALRAGDPREPAPIDRRADGVRELVLARPFRLERAWTHVWRAEQPRCDAGWLVVLAVDPGLVKPHQMAEPVLYAGAETVERVNHGDESGRVVAIVPCARGADGAPALDLTQVPFFFGAEDLPEEVTAREAAHQLERALRGGARPFGATEVAQALARGGGPLALPSRDELDQAAALLVLEHSPQELDLGLGMLAPRPR